VIRSLSPQQWKTGIAAWLGWLFDGLEMHLYTLVAAPFVMQLVGAATLSSPEVKSHSAWIQAAFLVGWALGGAFFGRLGDRIGRARALSLTVLTYAIFTGLSFFTTEWWHLLIFRFLAALGIGGEWAVGASLLSETWPKRWRPWIAAVLQTGVNLGILLACVVQAVVAGAAPWLAEHFSAWLPAGWEVYPRFVFLAGVLPAALVWWIRRAVPEPAEWELARKAETRVPRLRDLFAPEIRRTTVLSLVVCATALSGWWAFAFWNHQHIRNLPDLASWRMEDRERFVATVFFVWISVSMAGNFFAGLLARFFGYRRAIALMFLGLGSSMALCYSAPRPHEAYLYWDSVIGFFSGVFGLFTMYLPPLFPTLLRTTGAGFCFNFGRIAAAGGTVYFGLYAQVGDFSKPLFYAGR
jgi:MFS family permease